MDQTIRLLLFDDDPRDRELIARALQREPGRLAVTPVLDQPTFERITQGSTFDIDLVITEYQLHWGDGLLVLGAIKARDPFCPVIMLTGSGSEEVAVAAMKAGLDDYIIKSARRYEQLPDAVRAALGRADLQRRAARLEAEQARLVQQEQEARATALQAADRTRHLQTFTAALAVAITPADVAAVLDHGLAALGARAGSLVLLTHGGTMLTIVGSYGYAPEVVKAWASFPIDGSTPLSDAVRSGQAIWIETRAELARHYPQLPSTTSVLRDGAWAAVPLAVDGRTFGGIGLSFAEERSVSAEDRAFVLALAQQCSQVLERVRLYEQEQQARAAAEVAQQRQTFLAEASNILFSSLEYEVTLRSVARLAVPALADWCAVDIRDIDERVQRLAVAHVDPDKVQWAHTLQQRYPARSDAVRGVPQVIRSGVPEFYPTISDDDLRLAAQDDDHLELLRAVGFTSAIIVPLKARTTTFGALTLVSAESRRGFTHEDLELAEEIGRRAGLAVDNAQLYRAAQEAVRVRDIFLSIASHELKTPLTSMLGYAHLLERRLGQDPALPERDRQALRVIGQQAARLNVLISALLDLSRIQTGQLSIERAPLDLAELVQRVIDDVRPTLRTHTIELVVAHPLVVEGDAVRLEQVLHNLVGNAIKYSPNGGPITVLVEQQQGYAAVAVRDQGIGIPAASQAQLFQRFFRAPNVNPQNISGMGIGLYVVREIVALHGGEVFVESAEGSGSTFTTRLPLWTSSAD